MKPEITETPQEADFLARMSHELRTPLNAIRGYTELLLEDKQSDQPDVAELQGILRATDRLSALVESVLDLNQLRSGKYRVYTEVVPLQPLVNEVERAVHDKALRNRNRMVIDVDPLEVVVDRRMMRQVVFNLVDNAVRFTVGGQVQIIGRAIDDDWFGLTVVDDGMGMTDAQIEACTKSFWQADVSTTRRYGGAGMGLAVCKGMVEAMGGQLHIESTFGEGATIHVVLPRIVVVHNTDEFDDETVLLR